MKRKTKISLSILSLLVAGLGILCYVRWGVWFGNPPEAPYITAPTPHRVLLTFGNDGPLSRMVSWQADSVLHTSYLELMDASGHDEAVCLPAEGEVFVSRSGKTAFYHVAIEKLQPGHQYRYRAVTNEQSSPWYHFSMPSGDVDKPGRFSFLYFGDVQDSIGGISNRLVREAWKAHPETEFVVFGGDLCERPTDAFWAETFHSIDSIAQTLPTLVCTGNHEYLKYPIRKLERRFSLTFPYFLRSMVGENQVYNLPYHDAQLYLLDSNRELPFLYTQRNWLEQKMKEKPARWNIVVLHHPIYSAKSGSNNLMQRLAFGDVLNDNADLVLQGHEHAYARMTQHGPRGEARPPIFTVSHCSPKHYRIEFSDRFDRFGTGTQYYQQITIHGDTLSMRTYDAQTQQLYDAVDLVKGEHDHPTLIDRARHIPERLEFTPRPGNKKDAQFAARIADYKRKKGLQ